MSIFGQVWLWSLAAFFAGVLVITLVFVLPLRRAVRKLESALEQAHADAARTPANAGAMTAESTGTAVFTPEKQHATLAATPPVRRTSFDEIDDDFAEYDASLAASSGFGAAAEEQHEEAPDVQPEPAEPAGEDLYHAAATQYLTPVGETSPGLDDPYRAAAAHYLQPEEAELSPLEQRLEPGELFEAAEPAAPADSPEPPDWFEDHASAERSAFQEPVDRTQIIGEHPGKRADDVPTGALETPDVKEPSVPDETPMETTQVLPKRQPREAPLGGFEPPRPIEPSMRAVERRDPDLTGGHSGSLFEPSVPAGAIAPEPPPARQATADAVPPGPFGPGSAMPRPGGGRPAEGFVVKASVTALRYCTEDSAQFPRMVAEVWFRTAEDAERVGFRPLT